MLECVGHIVDAELVISTRVRWIVAQDRPDIVGYDQDLWVDALHHDEDDPEILLGLFDGLRRANLDLWSRIPVSARSRVGLHRERGPESYELTTRLSAGHDRVHMAQARRTWRAAPGPAGSGRRSRPLTTSSSRAASLSTSGPVSAQTTMSSMRTP